MRNRHELDSEYDLTGMIARPLYFGMLVNIMIPAGLLFLCYYISNRWHPENYVPGFANELFYIFCALALAQAGLALWMRNQRLELPMVRREESFEHDISTELFRRLKPVFVLIAAMSLWGVAYFFLTGRFTESVVFVVLAFVVFQLVRPRFGSVRKLIAFQQDLVKRGEFMGGGLSEIRRQAESE